MPTAASESLQPLQSLQPAVLAWGGGKAATALELRSLIGRRSSCIACLAANKNPNDFREILLAAGSNNLLLKKHF